MRGGWALLLCAYLLVCVPISVAGELVSTLPTLRMRGTNAVIELCMHAVVAIFSAVAGRMMLVGSPAGFIAASIAVIASGVIGIQSLYWTVLPRNVAPGSELPLAALSCSITILWLALIRRLRRSSAQSSR